MWEKFLIALANDLDDEGKFDLADKVDNDFEEFLKLLEDGELDFNYTFPSGSRDPLLPRSNFGGELTLSGIPGPQ